MSQPFTSCFTFLQRKTKFLLNMNHMMSCLCWRKRPNNRFSSSNFEFSSSFFDMGLSRQFQQVFKLIDTNGDGKISSTELSEVLSCLGYNKGIAEKEAEVMVKVLDFNGDGFVDFDEFMVVMKGNNKIEEQEQEEQEQEIGEDHDDDEYLMDAFLLYDTDKNGLISAKELRRVLMNLGCDHCSIRECKKMIKGVDKNGDGFVDFDEFRSMMKKGLTN